jgi:hypothetical protein
MASRQFEKRQQLDIKEHFCQPVFGWRRRIGWPSPPSYSLLAVRGQDRLRKGRNDGRTGMSDHTRRALAAYRQRIGPVEPAAGA